MSNTDTPETNLEVSTYNGIPIHLCRTEFAKKLERERDAVRRERDELSGKLHRWQERCASMQIDVREKWSRIESERDALKAELATAKVDTARLDWLEKNQSRIFGLWFDNTVSTEAPKTWQITTAPTDSFSGGAESALAKLNEG